jgi:hypothetical protein
MVVKCHGCRGLSTCTDLKCDVRLQAPVEDLHDVGNMHALCVGHVQFATAAPAVDGDSLWFEVAKAALC